MNIDIKSYNEAQNIEDKEICDFLATSLNQSLSPSESKIWHAHPVWFLDGNPIAGYSKQKNGIRFMFWSGASFDEPGLNVIGKKFKDASIFYKNIKEVNSTDVNRWIQKSIETQWDYKNIVKRKGILERLT